MKSEEFITKLLRDFIFLDCRLAQHPNITPQVEWFVKPKEVKRFLHDEDCGAHGDGLDWRRTVAFIETKAIVSSSHQPKRKQRIDIPILHGSITVGVLRIHLSEPLINAYQRRDVAASLGLLAQLTQYSKVYLGEGVQVVPSSSFKLGEALRRARWAVGLTKNELAKKINRDRISIWHWESGTELPTADSLYEWLEGLSLLSPDEVALVKIVDISSDVLNLLRETPERLFDLSPDQFERLVAERLDHMGYEVNITGATNLKDGGIDLIAVPKTPTVATFLLAVQVKHHRSGRKTGRDAADRLLAWKDTEFRLGLLVTNTEFTKDARWVAEQERNRAFLRLRDFEDLKRWLENNFWDERYWREIPDEIEVAPGIIVPVPRPRISNPEEIWPDLKFEERK